MILMVDDTLPEAREAALQALGEIGPSSKAAVPINGVPLIVNEAKIWWKEKGQYSFPLRIACFTHFESLPACCIRAILIPEGQAAHLRLRSAPKKNQKTIKRIFVFTQEPGP
jgi:hypothetical protein